MGDPTNREAPSRGLTDGEAGRRGPPSGGSSPPVGMYSRCIRCHADLGRNGVLETFPVGERIAYDLDRGRMWVICPACRRWNLSPLLSRWEAMETAERRFRETSRRVSTENIGLARLREGLELVRVGDPLRDEFAAWRYADRFGRRRRQAALWAGGGLLAAGALVAGGTVLGIATGAVLAQLVNIPIQASRWVWSRRVVARVPDGLGGETEVRGSDLQRTRLRRAEGDRDWRLIVPLEGDEAELTGSRGLHTAGTLLTHVNLWGASRSEVERAVEALEEHGHPDGFFDEALREAAREGHGYTPISGLPRDYRIPLEMAAHEESERRALEGELEELERAWREAEEIAAIADDLLLPEWVEQWIRRQRRRITG